MYSNHEMADMHFCYGMANGSNPEARRLYHERLQRLQETGQLGALRIDVGRHTERNVRLDEDIIQSVIDNPNVSTRQLEAQFGVPRQIVWEIIHNAGYYPYHLQRVQALYPGDCLLRLEFCRWFLNEPQVKNENFGWRVLFTDE